MSNNDLDSFLSTSGRLSDKQHDGRIWKLIRWLILRILLSAVVGLSFESQAIAPEIPHTALADEVAQTEVVEEKTTEDVVREYFADIPEMIEVARCESHFRHYLEDGSVLRGRQVKSDVGVMQVNTYYHGETAEELGLDLLDLEENLAYARYLYTKQGLQPWSASKPCWRRAVAQLN